MLTNLVSQNKPNDVSEKRSSESLIKAVMKGDTIEIGFLVANGYNVDSQDRFGDTALHHAVLSDRLVACVELLLNSGANPNLRNVKGYTALHNSVLVDCLPALRRIAQRADLSVTDGQGSTALCLAVEKSSIAAVRAIENAYIQRLENQKHKSPQR